MILEKPILENKTAFKSSNIIRSVCFSPDLSKLCSGGYHSMLVWNTQTLKKISESTKSGEIESINYSPDGIFLVTGSHSMEVRIWKFEGKELSSVVLQGHRRPVYSAKFSHSGKKVISGSFDKTIKIWDIERKKVTSTLSEKLGSVHDVDISSDDNLVLSGDLSFNTILSDLRSKKYIHNFRGHNHYVLSVQFQPNSTTCFATGSADKTIKLFDFRTFKLLQDYKEHTIYVESISFHPSGRYLISGCYDKTIKLFDILKEKVLFTMTEHSGPVYSVRFSSDGKYFASGSADKSVFLWKSNVNEDFYSKKDVEERKSYLLELFSLEELLDGFKIIIVGTNSVVNFSVPKTFLFPLYVSQDVLLK